MIIATGFEPSWEESFCVGEPSDSHTNSKIAAAFRIQSMKIGIGLPATIPNVPWDLVLEWAKRADNDSFSTLGIIDRLVYPNYEPMMTLAAVASVTERVRLMTTILIAPLRNTAVLAKQAATLDRISGGRLTLGLAIGGREDDFLAAGVPYKTRASKFEEQLRLMKRVWSGEAIGEGVGKIGPPPVQPVGPEILIGGYSPAAVSRASRFADGFIAAGGQDPQRVASIYKSVQDSWKAAGRKGQPRLVCAAYYALGANAADRGSLYIRNYYGFLGPMVDNIARGILSTQSAVRSVIKSLSEIGADELVLWPCIPDLKQVDLASKCLD
jgi:alkanesulfonate monooxygenase SsuD/methylene tetrahydromethanopterin reductase-like flavin-dependent oxidoreductase (luciferase family)